MLSEDGTTLEKYLLTNLIAQKIKNDEKSNLYSSFYIFVSLNFLR